MISKILIVKFYGTCINEIKTAYMILSPKGKQRQQVPNPLSITRIRQVNVVNLLGNFIDNRLSSSHHIEDIMKNRLEKFIPIFYEIENFLSTKTTCMLILYMN